MESRMSLGLWAQLLETEGWLTRASCFKVYVDDVAVEINHVGCWWVLLIHQCFRVKLTLLAAVAHYCSA